MEITEAIMAGRDNDGGGHGWGYQDWGGDRW